MRTDQMEFTPIQKFPLNLFPGFQPDGRRQGQWKAHIESGVLAARADGLNTQRIGSRHFLGLDCWFYWTL
jgi:hypothetical protein